MTLVYFATDSVMISFPQKIPNKTVPKYENSCTLYSYVGVYVRAKCEFDEEKRGG